VLYSGTRPGPIVVIVRVHHVRWRLRGGAIGWSCCPKRGNKLVVADICTYATSCRHP